MSLLTELIAFFGNDCYKYVAPAELRSSWATEAANIIGESRLSTAGQTTLSRASLFFVPTIPQITPPNLCAFASLADVAKGGDGAKPALPEIFLLATYSKNRVVFFAPGSRFTHD